MLVLLYLLSLIHGDLADPCGNVVLPSVDISRAKNEDAFLVKLSGDMDNQFTVRNEDGEVLHQSSSVFRYNPSDCDKTTYSVTMTAECDDGQDHEIDLGTVTLEPIPIDDMVSFDYAKQYHQLRGQSADEGSSVTMVCQSPEDAEKLYDFQPIYKWFKLDSMARDRLQNPVSEVSTSNVLVIDQVTCKDAGHYFCKIRRCPQHPEVTEACNNNDLAVKLNSPAPVTTDKCRVYGDPHVITFDGARFNYRGECWYVLAMDKQHYKWFVYGYFAPCGERSHCLETVSLVARTTENPGWAFSTEYMDDCPDNHFITGGAQVQLLRGFGANLGGEKTFIRRDSPLKFQGTELLFKGDRMELTVPEFGLKIKWDGLIAATIYVNKGTPTLGVCGDNDGDDSNDLQSFFDGKDRSVNSFVDAWSLGNGCMLSNDMPPQEKKKILSIADLLAAGTNPNYFPEESLRKYCKDTMFGFRSESQLKSVALQLPEGVLDTFVDSCVHDTIFIDYGWFDEKFSYSSCVSAHMLAEEAEEQGVCIEEWNVGSGCPSAKQMREESVRIGCIWNDGDREIVLW